MFCFPKAYEYMTVIYSYHIQVNNVTCPTDTIFNCATTLLHKKPLKYSTLGNCKRNTLPIDQVNKFVKAYQVCLPKLLNLDSGVPPPFIFVKLIGGRVQVPRSHRVRKKPLLSASSNWWLHVPQPLRTHSVLLWNATFTSQSMYATHSQVLKW